MKILIFFAVAVAAVLVTSQSPKLEVICGGWLVASIFGSAFLFSLLDLLKGKSKSQSSDWQHMAIRRRR